MVPMTPPVVETLGKKNTTWDGIYTLQRGFDILVPQSCQYFMQVHELGLDIRRDIYRDFLAQYICEENLHQ